MDSNHGVHELFRGNLSSKSADKRGAYETLTLADNLRTDTLVVARYKEPASWTLELITLALSVLFFAAQVATLVWVIDKPYYQVWRAPLSLNAVIAILTTASKASQLHSVGKAIGQLKWVYFETSPRRLRQFELYDATSRGPHGAVEFILKGRWGLATVGAFIIIFALTADPFTQQVVELKAQNVTTPDDTAVFGFSRGYDTNPPPTGLNTAVNPSSWFPAPEYHASSVLLTIRNSFIQGAILRGIYDIKSPDEFQCGGAYSWDGTYTSLGFSSSCRDIKATAEATKVCSKEGPAGTILCNYIIYFSTEYIFTDSATALIVAVNDTFFHSIIAVFQSNSDNITECTLSLSLHEYSNITANGSQLLFAHKSVKLEPGWFNVDLVELRNITFNQSESGPIDPPFVVNAYDWASAVYFFESNSSTFHIISGNAIKGKDTDRVGTGVAFLNADVPNVFAALAGKDPNVEFAHGARVESVVYLAALIFVIWVIIHNKRYHIPGWNLDQGNSLVTTFSGPKVVDQHARNVDAQLE
ncbi:hypothetical protein F4782DRAFT_543696 [Xylaria castorea]|nr:hypothetical protein F4782DRAFT_543696 [Xylaria castorea]